MSTNVREQRGILSKDSGVTLMELLVVGAIFFMIAALAVPAFTQWRQNLEYRKTARNIVRLLRETRSTAIAMNREHRVEFEPSARRYGLRAGDRPFDTKWPNVPPVSDWISCPPEVNISANVHAIQFNTNGTANGGTITVNDGTMTKKYSVIVARTGRIRIQ